MATRRQKVSKKKNRKKKKSSRIINVILVLMLLSGLSLLLYPTFADWWNSMHQAKAIASYVQAVSDMSEEENERLWKEAEEYNKEHAERGNSFDITQKEREEYKKILNVTGNGIMGYISIPKIKIELPIYHGTSDKVLQVAIGHLAGTSLPVGGKSTHCVVSGHRGLPSARLFTDIDKLVERDTFTITVLDRTMTYEVDQIRTVLPQEVQDLQIEEGKDYVTLVTCTPYGINTHRLLVRGHRIPNKADDMRISADALKIDPLFVAPGIAAFILGVLLLWMILNTRSRRKAEKFKKQYEEQYDIHYDDDSLERGE